MKPHPDQKEFERLFPYIREYQALASKHGIGDIFRTTAANCFNCC